ncbi:MAG: hypothetical protein O8C63_03365 [Candidatus Methanoperedens sp.]|nr:hypothetical protein [Candidatus Methanoperedens sp.]
MIMKKIKQYLISMFLIIFLINTAYGFAGMTSNKSTTQPDLINSTESDQDIVLVQHLIVIDAVQLQSENRLFVSETLALKNIGTKNFNGSLRTWVPDGAEGFRVGKTEMAMGATPTPIQLMQDGNIISWKDIIKANDTASLYVVEYLLPAENTGMITKSKYFSKKLTYPTLINYKYVPIKGLPLFILKLTVSKDNSIALFDENGNKITPQEIGEADNSIINRWSDPPQFKEITVEISRPAATPSGIAAYVVLGLLIIFVFSYLFIRKKNEKIRQFEEKIRNSLKRKETVDETVEETGEEDAGETATPEPVETEATDFEGKTKDELEVMKDETLSKLSELNKEYESGNMLDEEYEELKSSYEKRIDKITRRIEKSR